MATQQAKPIGKTDYARPPIDGDFYKIDPHLFSPAEITFQNIHTGRVHTFGQLTPGILARSFGT